MSEGGKTAIEANDKVVSVAEVKSQEKRIRQLGRVLGNKTLGVEIHKKSVRIGREKNSSRDCLVRRGGSPVRRLPEARRRPNTYERTAGRARTNTQTGRRIYSAADRRHFGRAQAYGYLPIRMRNGNRLPSGARWSPSGAYRIMRQNNLLLTRVTGRQPGQNFHPAA